MFLFKSKERKKFGELVDILKNDILKLKNLGDCSELFQSGMNNLLGHIAGSLARMYDENKEKNFYKKETKYYTDNCKNLYELGGKGVFKKDDVGNYIRELEGFANILTVKELLNIKKDILAAVEHAKNLLQEELTKEISKLNASEKWEDTKKSLLDLSDGGFESFKDCKNLKKLSTSKDKETFIGSIWELADLAEKTKDNNWQNLLLSGAEKSWETWWRRFSVNMNADLRKKYGLPTTGRLRSTDPFGVQRALSSVFANGGAYLTKVTLGNLKSGTWWDDAKKIIKEELPKKKTNTTAIKINNTEIPIKDSYEKVINDPKLKIKDYYPN